MVSILVTGTNQGIGLGIIQELAKRQDVDRIFATVRDPKSAASADLKKLESSTPKIVVVELQLNEKSAAVPLLHGYAKGIVRRCASSSKPRWERPRRIDKQYWHRAALF